MFHTRGGACDGSGARKEIGKAIHIAINGTE
jgi:hypothetical protein